MNNTIPSANLQNFIEPYLELDPNKILYAPNLEGVIEYEEFRDIPNFEGRYQISNFGRVKSLARKTYNKQKNRYTTHLEKIMKPIMSSNYFRCALCLKGKYTQFQIHQLVAIGFLGHIPCGHKLVVDHKDNIPSNNRLYNLQIITHRYNLSKDVKNKTSKYTGVAYNKSNNNWRSQIYFKGDDVQLGYYKSELKAAQAYQEALRIINNGGKVISKKPNYTSEYKGVHWSNIREKWLSKISINKKDKHLGCFDSEIKAHLAYEKALKCISEGKEIDKPITSSKYKGVSYNKQRKKFEANLNYNKIKYRLGAFENEIDAHNAYQNKLKALTQ